MFMNNNFLFFFYSQKPTTNNTKRSELFCTKMYILYAHCTFVCIISRTLHNICIFTLSKCIFRFVYHFIHSTCSSLSLFSIKTKLSFHCILFKVRSEKFICSHSSRIHHWKCLNLNSNAWKEEKNNAMTTNKKIVVGFIYFNDIANLNISLLAEVLMSTMMMHSLTHGSVNIIKFWEVNEIILESFFPQKERRILVRNLNYCNVILSLSSLLLHSLESHVFHIF